MAWNFTRVAGPFEFTEGPVWDGERVLFTDDDCIRRYDPETGTCDVWFDDVTGALGMHFGPDGALYVCEGSARQLSRIRDGSKEVVSESFRGSRFNGVNDLEFDADGRLWFTDPTYGMDEGDLELAASSVYRIDDPTATEPTVKRMTEDTWDPNGLLVSKDQEVLYVAQSHYGEGNDRELRAYHIDENGDLGGHRVLHDFYPHRGIDGMTFDTAGNVVACAGWEESGPGPMLYVFAPSGRVLATHPIEETPTHCCFGGSDRRDIYVTTHDGSLYRARTDRHGRDDRPSAAST